MTNIIKNIAITGTTLLTLGMSQHIYGQNNNSFEKQMKAIDSKIEKISQKQNKIQNKSIQAEILAIKYLNKSTDILTGNKIQNPNWPGISQKLSAEEWPSIIKEANLYLDSCITTLELEKKYQNDSTYNDYLLKAKFDKKEINNIITQIIKVKTYQEKMIKNEAFLDEKSFEIATNETNKAYNLIRKYMN